MNKHYKYVRQSDMNITTSNHVNKTKLNST